MHNHLLYAGWGNNGTHFDQLRSAGSFSEPTCEILWQSSETQKRQPKFPLSFTMHCILSGWGPVLEGLDDLDAPRELHRDTSTDSLPPSLPPSLSFHNDKHFWDAFKVSVSM